VAPGAAAPKRGPRFFLVPDLPTGGPSSDRSEGPLMQHQRIIILGDGHLGWAVAAAASDRGLRTPVLGRPPGARHDAVSFDRTDLVVDATVATAVPGNVRAALEAGVRRFVIATTGWSDDRETVDAALRAAGASAVAASNFSLGV